MLFDVVNDKRYEGTQGLAYTAEVVQATREIRRLDKTEEETDRDQPAKVRDRRGRR